ncbi:uncharacterized [Tachysurus ichikawai]
MYSTRQWTASKESLKMFVITGCSSLAEWTINKRGKKPSSSVARTTNEEKTMAVSECSSSTRQNSRPTPSHAEQRTQNETIRFRCVFILALRSQPTLVPYTLISALSSRSDARRIQIAQPG